MVMNTDAFFLSHRLHLANGARCSGFEVHIAAPKGEATEKIRNLDFSFHNLRMGRKSMNPITELVSIFNLLKILVHLKPDVVHLFTIKPVLYGLLATRIVGTPKIVVTITGLGYLFLQNGFKAKLKQKIVVWLYKKLLNQGNVTTIFQNTDDRNLFLKNNWVNEINSTVIKGTGVDTQKFVPTSKMGTKKNNDIVVTFPARFLKDKGLIETIEACRLIKHKYKKKFQLWLCGSIDPGNPSSVNNEFIEKLKNEDFVVVKGFINEMAHVYAQTTIVCLPSYREGIPLALIEACACGLPIVTTDVPGCREVVAHEQNGYLVPAQNINNLAECLVKLMGSEILRKKFGQTSLRKAHEEFDKEITVQQNLKIYGAVVADLSQKMKLHK